MFYFTIAVIALATSLWTSDLAAWAWSIDRRSFLIFYHIKVESSLQIENGLLPKVQLFAPESLEEEKEEV